MSRFPVAMSTDTSENALHQAMASALVKTFVAEQDLLFKVVFSELLSLSTLFLV